MCVWGKNIVPTLHIRAPEPPRMLTFFFVLLKPCY